MGSRSERRRELHDAGGSLHYVILDEPLSVAGIEPVIREPQPGDTPPWWLY